MSKGTGPRKWPPRRGSFRLRNKGVPGRVRPFLLCLPSCAEVVYWFTNTALEVIYVEGHRPKEVAA